MGLRQFTTSPREAAWGAINGSQEKYRRARAQRRLDIYGDNYEHILLGKIDEIYEAAEIKAQLAPFAALAVANSLLKRIVNEIARPIYALPPRRKVTGSAGANAAYKALCREMRVDRVMDAAIRRVRAANHCILFCRYVEGAGMSLDILTPSQVTVVPHPDRPSVALAVAYDKDVTTMAGPSRRYVVWDDEQYFEIDAAGFPATEPVRHGLGRIPMVQMHLSEPVGTYWDPHTGSDLEAAAIQSSLLDALKLKLHYCQGEKVVAEIGDGESPQNQTLDGLNLLKFPGGTILTELNLVTDPGHYLRSKAELETTVAANHGISRARLNQEDKGQDDVGLRERTAELVQVAREAELDLFEVVKLVSREHPLYQIPEDARLSADFGQPSARTDRKAQLDIRKTERSDGVRNVLDDIMEDNPEIDDEDEAWTELDENMAVEAEFVRRRRALQIPEDVSVDEPGQDAAVNGAMGPKVRDGEMTKDEAADQAAKGPTNTKPDLRALAMRVLKKKAA